MAFPGTFNISYYKGDTYEFKVYPKEANGSPFDLTNYTTNPKFSIALTRGPLEENIIAGYAEVSSDKTYILCAIDPVVGGSLDATKNYVYDVQIINDSAPYDYVYTVLTGTITITDQVTVSGV
jgi:hypothetical protein